MPTKTFRPAPTPMDPPVAGADLEPAQSSKKFTQSGVQDKIPDDNDNESSPWTMNVDPSNWGNIDFEEEDLDLEAQATAFKLWKLVKEKTQFLRKLALGCPVPEPI
ncbi:hypothetical protein BDN71DRAFT_1507564 [Pleurotus eryngii]|uniref:Uncharacterized protein n=1 Tax=Pleurotus eryngii TaxID=5323 RepID=A0A9P5ZVT7_PLEER|nr:hypothetical protein BDN71DRAFT_1507564 [Pleurotus eryngii]